MQTANGELIRMIGHFTTNRYKCHADDYAPIAEQFVTEGYMRESARQFINPVAFADSSLIKMRRYETDTEVVEAIQALLTGHEDDLVNIHLFNAAFNGLICTSGAVPAAALFHHLKGRLATHSPMDEVYDYVQDHKRLFGNKSNGLLNSQMVKTEHPDVWASHLLKTSSDLSNNFLTKRARYLMLYHPLLEAVIANDTKGPETLQQYATAVVGLSQVNERWDLGNMLLERLKFDVEANAIAAKLATGLAPLRSGLKWYFDNLKKAEDGLLLMSPDRLPYNNVYSPHSIHRHLYQRRKVLIESMPRDIKAHPVLAQTLSMLPKQTNKPEDLDPLIFIRQGVTSRGAAVKMPKSTLVDKVEAIYRMMEQPETLFGYICDRLVENFAPNKSFSIQDAVCNMSAKRQGYTNCSLVNGGAGDFASIERVREGKMDYGHFFDSSGFFIHRMLGQDYLRPVKPHLKHILGELTVIMAEHGHAKWGIEALVDRIQFSNERLIEWLDTDARRLLTVQHNPAGAVSQVQWYTNRLEQGLSLALTAQVQLQLMKLLTPMLDGFRKMQQRGMVDFDGESVTIERLHERLGDAAERLVVAIDGVGRSLNGDYAVLIGIEKMAISPSLTFMGENRPLRNVLDTSTLPSDEKERVKIPFEVLSDILTHVVKDTVTVHTDIEQTLTSAAYRKNIEKVMRDAQKDGSTPAAKERALESQDPYMDTL